MSKMLSDLSMIVEANLDQLIEVGPQSLTFNPVVSTYYQILLAYHRTDINELMRWRMAITIPPQQSGAATNFPFLELVPLLDLRIQLRSPNICRSQIDSAVENPLPATKILSAEKHFLLALCFGRLGKLNEQKQHYLLAAHLYDESQVHRKALKCYQNAIATEAAINPNKRYFIEYHHLLRKSLKLREFIVAGLCSINIAREFLRLGSMQIALQYAKKSLVYLKRDAGSQHFALAQCLQAEILIELQQFDQAALTLEAATVCTNAQVQEEISKLLELIPPNRSNGTSNSKPLRRFAILEERLIEILSKNSMTTPEIVASLYKEELPKLEYEILLNRFKNLLARIRKKSPSLIVFINSEYSLNRSILN